MDAEIDLVNVPSDEILKKKLYYPIREVAAFFNVNASLIRVWETEFDILQPRKNRKGDRLFRVEDIKNIQVIYYLLRNRKFSLDGAKKYLKENKGKLTTNQQLIQSLIQLKSFLTEIKTSLLVKNN
ncbi:MAG: MerR family transcriptional regulator [Chitinophagaceae bacterium]|nr:MerR family transcriptional regulator [Chitinophagaceae bacterium]